jgi:hypothetical protein
MAINRRSISVLGPTGQQMNVTSDPVKGDSYFGYTDGLHTIQAEFEGFVGRFRIQATLALEPTESDWFSVPVQGFTQAGRDFYAQWFPAGNNPGPFTGTVAYTFTGNFTWIRVQLERSHLGDGETFDNYGQVNQVLMSA